LFSILIGLVAQKCHFGLNAFVGNDLRDSAWRKQTQRITIDAHTRVTKCKPQVNRLMIGILILHV
jgi:hypothetical protein